MISPWFRLMVAAAAGAAPRHSHLQAQTIAEDAERKRHWSDAEA